MTLIDPVDDLVEIFADPVLIGILVVLLLFVFFGYLLMRRTVLGLREGYRDGQRRE